MQFVDEIWSLEECAPQLQLPFRLVVCRWMVKEILNSQSLRGDTSPTKRDRWPNRGRLKTSDIHFTLDKTVQLPSQFLVTSFEIIIHN